MSIASFNRFQSDKLLLKLLPASRIVIRITPELFRKAFLQVVSNYQTDIQNRFDKSRDYTVFVRQTILPAIAPLLSLKIYSADYYTIDCIYYSERDIEHFGAQSTYATHCNIALEHENSIRSTAIEMNKLQLLNAPLKVLITYCRHATERSIYLERYNKIVQNGDIFGDFATLRRQLVIFGYRHESAIHWHFYAYEQNGFQEI